MFPGNPVIAIAIAELFGSGKDSDCSIIFYVEERVPGGGEASEEAESAPSMPADGAQGPNRKTRKVERNVGSPLPGHQHVLRYASERFRAKIDRWTGEQRDGGKKEPSLELRVSLNSEDEEPAARAAIGLAYTGRVQAGSMREALEVRRQTAYLQVEGGVEACDEFMRSRLHAASSDCSSSGDESGVEGGGTGQPLVLAFFSCTDLFPSPTEEPSFGVVLTWAKLALAHHFRDAPAVLNTRRLRTQLLALPAVAMEALLGSDAFGTDTEASVLLLLATWMKANFQNTDAPTRARLCRLVRLLPALATDFSTGGRKGLPRAWFPIRFTEAAFIANLSSTSHLTSPTNRADARVKLAAAGSDVYDLSSPWYNFAARPQCVDTTYKWSINEQELEKVLEADAGGAPGGQHVPVTFQGGSSSIAAQGLMWELRVLYGRGASTAGLLLTCNVPAAYKRAGARAAKKLAGVADLNVLLLLHWWQDGSREDRWSHSNTVTVVLGTGSLVGAIVLPPEAAGIDGMWSGYLHEGKISGSLMLMPPPPQSPL
ncbi:hypothetical protein TSOC_004127 [Tetrabaena socialis]|uniref:BACK domain-containing protein n=1 Tax=Tetrabaena socialis TaxID=47790 RepID=A0A2J8A9Q2_9CHLO|nr:hypothetical protein TSOC_004127 [Tetrabaena socialis]|eukprot:PNH09258.1 hypothetical protein TSOC_004127 [Tetrabaena socialis]